MAQTRSNTIDNVFRIGEVYAIKFDGEGSEQTGLRPGVIFQNNVGNAHSPNVIVLPLTSSIKKLDLPTHVLIKSCDSGLNKDSMVICENPVVMSKNKIGRYITTLSEEYMRRITVANLLATSSISYLDLNTLISAWRKAIALNAA